MKIELLVDLTNHKAGTKIDVQHIYAARMIKNGIAKEQTLETVEIVEKDVVQSDIPNEETKPKKKGNPNWGKRK